MILAPSIQPTAEPLCLNEAKLALRVDGTGDDEFITAMIRSARQWCETYENQAYMMRTSIVYLDAFPEVIRLPMPPLISVPSIRYVDVNGDTQTVTSTVYTVDTDSIPGRIYLAYNQSWPAVRAIPKAITVTFRHGYATTFTAAADDTITVGEAFFADTDRVRLGISAEDDAAIPTGLAINTDYYVRDVSGSTLKLAATSGGTAIDITAVGTGTFYMAPAARGLVPERVSWAMKLILGHLYEHREQLSEMPLQTMDFGVKDLLTERVW